MIRYTFAAVVLWLLAAVPFAAGALGEEQLIPVATKIMIFAAAAVGLAFIMGAGGLVKPGPCGRSWASAPISL